MYVTQQNVHSTWPSFILDLDLDTSNCSVDMFLVLETHVFCVVWTNPVTLTHIL